MKVRLDHHDQINHNVRTFYFVPEKQLGYTAGQFIEATVFHDNPDDRGVKRWFTLSSSPEDEFLTITTKFASETSTFKHALLHLKPGDTIEFSESMGDFVLPKDASIPLVFIAGGIGVTPYHSIVSDLLARGERRDIQVILAAATPDDIVFADLFQKYRARTTCIVSHPTPQWSGLSGKLTGARILDIIGSSEGKRLYLSGPEQMVEAIQKELTSYGLSDDQFVGDFFPGYPDPSDS